MTSHNLDEHLAWLLKEKPTVPRANPRQISTNTTTIPSRLASSQESLPPQQSTETHRFAARNSAQRTITSSFAVPPPRRPTPPSNPQPAPASAPQPNAREQSDHDHMARLNTTSKAFRPTLLSAQSPRVSTPAPCAQSSLSAAYAAQLQWNNSLESTPSRGAPLGRSKSVHKLSTPRTNPSQFSSLHFPSRQIANIQAKIGRAHV